jgi:hypothetical protein
LSSRAVYNSPDTSIETLLRMAAASSWPWDAPSFLREWIDRALERARRVPGLCVEVPVPWWRRLLGTPYPDALSVSLEELPSAAGPIRLVVLCASSDSPAVLVSNLLLAVRVVGGRPDELVKTLETRGVGNGMHLHAIACIPGSVKG